MLERIGIVPVGERDVLEPDGDGDPLLSRAASADALRVSDDDGLVAAGIRRTTPVRARGAALVGPTGVTIEALGAIGERAMIRPTCSALRSSGLSSRSSKKRGVGDG